MHKHIASACAAATLLTTASAASAASMALGWPGAQAAFVNYDAAGCIRTQVDVFVRGAGIGDGAAAAKLFLAVSRVDECRDVELVRAERRLPLSAGAFRQEADLSSATLNQAVMLHDGASRRPVRLTIKVAWTATEEAVTAPVGSVTQGLGEVSRARAPTMQTIRLGAASGSIVTDSIQLPALSTTDAQLSRTWAGRRIGTSG